MTEAEAARPGGLFFAGDPVPLVGVLMPGAPWEGRVVGVFSAAVSILHPDGALVSVVDRESRMEARALAHAAGWRGFADAAASRMEESADAPVTARWDGRLLALMDSSRPSALDFSGAVPWDPRARYPIKGALPPEEAAAAAAAIEQGIALAEARHGRYGGIHDGSLWSDAFARLTESGDFPACLAGFGPGTTPSGDDWLSGYLCGRDLLAGGCGRGEPGLRAALAGRLGRTTAAGRALLLGAIAGVLPAYLSRLACEVSAHRDRTREDGLRSAVSGALGHGASSGRDALGGFLAGLLPAGFLV